MLSASSIDLFCIERMSLRGEPDRSRDATRPARPSFRGAVGIGFALIIAPTLALVDASLLPVTLLILMLPLNFVVAWRERDAIDRQGTTWITVGRFFGTFLGMAVLVAVIRSGAPPRCSAPGSTPTRSRSTRVWRRTLCHAVDVGLPCLSTSTNAPVGHPLLWLPLEKSVGAAQKSRFGG